MKREEDNILLIKHNKDGRFQAYAVVPGNLVFRGSTRMRHTLFES
jgi:hypothetical protein